MKHMAVVNKINQNGFVTELVREGTDLVLDITGVVVGDRNSVDTLTNNTTLNDISGKVYLINATSTNVIINLPNTVSIDGFKLTIKKIDKTNNEIKLQPASLQQIDGDNFKTITQPYVSVAIISKDGDWWII